MDTRKTGIHSFTKAGCYYILFGAILGGIIGIVSLFVKFEDPAKMVLDFHPPKAMHRDEIRRVCEGIHKHHNRTRKPLAVFLSPLVLGLFCFAVAKVVLDPAYFLYHLKTIFMNAFFYPALFWGIISFFIWGMIYRGRMDEIRDGAYAVAEVDFVEKYYCVHTSARAHFSEYFVILADSHGNKGRFKVSESEYYRFHADNTILLVKRSKGKL